MYALKEKGKFNFYCVSKTLGDFDKKIMKSFQNWRGWQSRGSHLTVDDFLLGWDKVEIEIKPYKQND